MYIKRLLEGVLKQAKTTFPAIVITGPRQSGKSTLLNNLPLGKEPTSISFENPRLRELIREDPLGFLKAQSKPIILDEIQYMPEILNYVKILIDEDRKPGSWFITGSQQFSVMKNVSESLAGRAAILTLPPFRLKERTDINSIDDFLFRGSYPELVVNSKINTDIWYSSYLQTYLERDVRQLLNVADLREFEQCLRLLAARTGQELNYSNLSSQLGVSVSTVKRWVSVLEASFVIFLLPPYFKNYGKRIVKAPKIYFYDMGLLNYLLGISKPEHIFESPMAGSLFETAVVSEMLKKRFSQGVKPEMYYWRSQSGVEIDLIVPEEGSYAPYEIKLSSAVKPQFYKNLKYWLTLSEQKSGRGYLITNCSEKIPLPPNIQNIHWKNL